MTTISQIASSQAKYWHVDSIVEKCLVLVDLNSAAILQSTEFTDISQDTLQKILKRDTLSAEENEIYLAAERWAEAACARNALDASGANRRQMLGDALCLVRFPLLTGTQLADGPGKSGLLSEGELLSVLLYQNATVKPQNLAFPTACRTGVCIGFTKGDEVFVESSGYAGSWWEPATICAVERERVSFTWCRTGMKGAATPDKMIPIKDILKKDQAVYAFSNGYVQYQHASLDGQHHISGQNGWRIVKLADLMLPGADVALWKARNGK
ncbi:BTB/POZ domain-containing protein 2-like [Paramacrobiotus metropolitanus]|uniref:BTB/POZ domain-containing protein 2-like n=1 Tax=Paramacrobiotus metropolitanus TaxID=2943436 RepID=UPI0024460E91|nr:BTB/POZ domain-containing protein 2-like [Paramacrobiotus metropolitanus]